MATQKKIKKVYLINQDYAFGQAVSKAAREMLGKKRPDVQIVGDDLHPLGKVKDFAPYIAKIKASGADTVVTGNWGADLALLVKAGKEAGLKVDYYTYYAGIAGGPTAIGEAGADHVKQVSHWHSNVGDPKSDAIVQQYRKRFPDSKDDFVWLAAYNAIEMLTKAMTESKSTDPSQGGARAGGHEVQDLHRRGQHARRQPPAPAADVRVDLRQGRDLGREVGPWNAPDWASAARAASRPRTRVQPTTCKMQRPG